MARKYAIRNPEAYYFITFTVIDWINAFSDRECCRIFLDSVKYCQKEKGLEVVAWCIMPNHIHLIVGSSGKMMLQGIIRDLKSFTSRQIRLYLTQNQFEGNNRFMLDAMISAGTKKSNNKDFQFWQQHNHPIELDEHEIALQRLDYLHENPVKAGLVEYASEWEWSSARDYEDKIGLLEIHFLY